MSSPQERKKRKRKAKKVSQEADDDTASQLCSLSEGAQTVKKEGDYDPLKQFSLGSSTESDGKGRNPLITPTPLRPFVNNNVNVPPPQTRLSPGLLPVVQGPSQSTNTLSSFYMPQSMSNLSPYSSLSLSSSINPVTSVGLGLPYVLQPVFFQLPSMGTNGLLTSSSTSLTSTSALSSFLPLASMSSPSKITSLSSTISEPHSACSSTCCVSGASPLSSSISTSIPSTPTPSTPSTPSTETDISVPISPTTEASLPVLATALGFPLSGVGLAPIELGRGRPLPRTGPPTSPRSPVSLTSRSSKSSGRKKSDRRQTGKHLCKFPGCTDGFPTRFSLKRHMKRHTGEKPFVCTWPDELETGGQCGKHFAEKSTLKRHLQTHTGEKPFRCTWTGCGKAFADRVNCDRHELLHNKASPIPTSLAALSSASAAAVAAAAASTAAAAVAVAAAQANSETPLVPLSLDPAHASAPNLYYLANLSTSLLAQPIQQVKSVTDT